MSDRAPDDKDGGVLLKVLTAHFHALASARSDETVLRQYSALLRFLKSGKGKFLGAPSHAERRSDPGRLLPRLCDEELLRASLDDIAKVVSDEATPRRDLECIAIQRFSVPRGSMRSFSNRRMLVSKLLTLIANERTHETIGAVARGQDKGAPVS
jgi:hypothetical protein